MRERRGMIRLVWINTIIVVLAVLVFLGVAFYVTSQKAGELETQRDALVQKAKTMAAKREELPNISNRSGQLLRESRKLVKLLPNNPSQKELVSFLQKNVDEANCEVLILNMRAPVDLTESIRDKAAIKTLQEELETETIDTTKAIHTSLTIRGGFENVLAFMENLKRSDRFFPIQKITAPEKGGSDTAFAEKKVMGFELEGWLYYTNLKVDIAERFDELRQSLERVLPTKPGEQVAEEEQELIKVARVPTEAPVTKEETGATIE
ncbi:hypothetical protein J7J84_01185 [bacterium]|nr:hypothetical protein [bacterium]